MTGINLDNIMADNEEVRLIENLLITPLEKIGVLLVYSGDKLANDNEFASPDKEHLGRVVGRFCGLLEKLKFPYKRIPVLQKTDGMVSSFEREEVLYAKNSENFRRFLEAREKTDEYEMGRCFGFPETAIKAYFTRRISVDEWPPIFHSFGFSFVLSQEFWQQELETPKRWLKVIRDLSPATYTEQLALSDGSHHLHALVKVRETALSDPNTRITISFDDSEPRTVKP